MQVRRISVTGHLTANQASSIPSTHHESFFIAYVCNALLVI